MHGCMTEYVVCNHPRADGRIAVMYTQARRQEVWQGGSINRTAGLLG